MYNGYEEFQYLKEVCSIFQMFILKWRKNADPLSKEKMKEKGQKNRTELGHVLWIDQSSFPTGETYFYAFQREMQCL